MKAAFGPISEVYGFEFREHNMDFCFFDLFQSADFKFKIPRKLYFVTNSPWLLTSQKSKPVFCRGLLKIQRIRNGQLPELILESYLAFYRCEKNPNPINSK